MQKPPKITQTHVKSGKKKVTHQRKECVKAKEEKKRLYRHETVELGCSDHLPQSKNLLVNVGLAGLARRPRRLCVLCLPWFWGVRHRPLTLSQKLSQKEKLLLFSVAVLFSLSWLILRI